MNRGEEIFVPAISTSDSLNSVVRQDGKGAPSKTLMINRFNRLDTLGRGIC